MSTPAPALRYRCDRCEYSTDVFHRLVAHATVRHPREKLPTEEVFKGFTDPRCQRCRKPVPGVSGEIVWCEDCTREFRERMADPVKRI